MRYVERIISQITYDRRRKQYITAKKRNKFKGEERRPEKNYYRGDAKGLPIPIMAIEGLESIKKILGMICITIGIMLLLTKCFSGNNKEAGKDLSKVETTVAFEKDTSYEAFVQDFAIGDENLKSLLDLSIRYKQDYAHTLAVWAVESYKGRSIEEIKQCIRQYDTSNLLDEFGMYDAAANVYKQFIYDVKCFPIKKANVYVYENGWKHSRTYNGNRLHYGIDIMARENSPGKIEVVSMTDGVVENIGWNQTGGYRVGVRTPGGAYFYYAHLDSYPEHLKKGDKIYAGERIGMMGDTGYGEEGTRGQFPVHLHIGIAVKTADEVEFWINPYDLLRYMEKK